MAARSQGGTRSIKVVLTLACLCASGQLLAASAGNRGVPDSVLSTVVGNDGDGAVAATTVPLLGLTGAIARDSAGNLYFSDANRILKLTAAGALTTYAGQRTASGFQGDGAPASIARFNTPNILTMDPNDNLYIVDSGNFRIRKISKVGVVSTVVGNGQNVAAVADIGRFATDARLPSPVNGIAVNAAGDIFFASTTGGAGNFIYEVPAATGKLTIFAGDGTATTVTNGASSTTTSLGSLVQSLAFLSDGSLIYAAGIGVVQITGGKLNVVAGLVNAANTLIGGAITFPDNGTQNALNASPASTVGFPANSIRNLTVDGSTIFFQDFNLNRLRSFTVGGKISTVFGEISQGGQTAFGGFRGNGTPAATNTPGGGADFTPQNDDPREFPLNFSALVASGGVVTFVDDSNWCVRQFTVGGNVNTIAGTPNQVRTDANPAAVVPAFQQALSNTAPVDARSVVLSLPTQIARDPSNGTFVFDAQDIYGFHDLMRYDPVAKQVSIVAGTSVTNGNPVGTGDGGPAVTVKPVGLGTQVATIAGGTAVFADTAPTGVSSNTIRAISPAGIITTVAGIPGIAGNRNPDVDLTIVNAANAAVNQPRIGSKATSCLFNHPDGVIATSASDLVIADTNNARLVVVAAGTVTQDINATINAAYVVALSPTVVVVADTVTPSNLVNINYTAAPVVGAAVPCNAGVSCRGLATGTLTSGAVVFVASGTVIDVRLQTTLGTYYTTTVPVPGATALIGMGSDGTNLYLTDTGANKLVRIPIAQFTGASGTAAPVLTPTVIANNFLATVQNNGFNLQTNFSLTAFAPVNLIGANVLVGDDGANQYRLLTLGATAPATTFVPFAGTGFERNGGVDGEPALNADSIGNVGGIAIDSTGAVFFSDQSERTVRKVAAGTITTVAGIPAHGGVLPNVDFQDGVNALQTTFDQPAGLAFNPAGELFIADTLGNAVRKLKTDGTIANVAGTAVNGGAGAGGDLGLAINARLFQPGPIASDPHGDLYILQTQDGRIRVVDPVTGIITSLAGGGKDPADSVPTDSKDVDLPSAGMTLDVAGKIFVTGNQNSSAGAGIVRVAGGLAQEVCGDHIVSGFNGDGLSIDSLLNFGASAPSGGISFDGGSGIVFCDTGNNLVRMITNLGEIGNTPPTAVIVATPATLGAAPFKPHLDGSQSTDPDGDIVNYQWDFGDGTTGSGPVVDHDYTAMGSYVVALTVTDSAGNTNTARSTVISAIPLLGSTTSGKGAFKITFGGKANSDSFSFSVTGIVLPGNVSGINLSGLPFTIFLGTFTGTGTTGGKGPKKSTLARPLAAKGNKNISATVDSTKGTVAASIKSATLSPAFADFGVTASNSDLGTRTALVPVVINIGGGTAIFGDRLHFFYKTKVKTSKGKTSGSASGKFSQ